VLFRRRQDPPGARQNAPDEAGATSDDCNLEDLVARAQAEPAFVRLCQTLHDVAVESWLTERERALLYGIGAFAAGEGTIVEVGSWKGGSASVLAGGISVRGRGRLTCVDPHVGGPPWLGLAPFRSSWQGFSDTVKATGAEELLDARVGDSTAVAASWPATPIDAVLIDGDHSLLGALRDIESWAPKLRPGGVLLIDDVDQPTLLDLHYVVEQLKHIDGLLWLGTIDGMTAFRREDTDPWRMLASLDDRMKERGVRRARDMAALITTPLPSAFLRSRDWEESELDTGYELCFLARCGPGPYAYSPTTSTGDRSLMVALSADRGDGDALELPTASPCRAVLCGPDEIGRYVSALQPGGVMVVLGDGDIHRHIEIAAQMTEAGLEGCDFVGRVHWGVRQPHQLSMDWVVQRAFAALSEPASPGPQEGQAPAVG
jgi:predicted O-methyltransferase YrrM